MLLAASLTEMPAESEKSKSTEQKLMREEVKIEYLNVSASR